jgi:NADPH:quinone reductase-like Zn-dependent oxidoreductase
VAMVLPLTEVKKAHQLSKSGHTRGKIVLQVGA